MTTLQYARESGHTIRKVRHACRKMGFPTDRHTHLTQQEILDLDAVLSDASAVLQTACDFETLYGDMS